MRWRRPCRSCLARAARAPHQEALLATAARIVRFATPQLTVGSCVVWGVGCGWREVQVQYREYQRACTNAGRKPTTDPKEASILCLVNPNNPTGDFLERPEMEARGAARFHAL